MDTKRNYAKDRKDIKRQTRQLSDERLKFKDGKRLGDLNPSLESGESRRKLRRIMEKRVCKDFWAEKKRIGKSEETNFARHTIKRHIANHWRNIYGQRYSSTSI